MAKALRQAGRDAEAEAALQRVIELDPSDLKSRVALSKTAWEQGKRSEAIALLEKGARGGMAARLEEPRGSLGRFAGDPLARDRAYSRLTAAGAMRRCPL